MIPVNLSLKKIKGYSLMVYAVPRHYGAQIAQIANKHLSMSATANCVSLL